VATSSWSTGRQAAASARAWDSKSTLSGLHHERLPGSGSAVWLCWVATGERCAKQPFTVTTHPIHILTLVAMGMQLLDNQHLEDVARHCAGDRLGSCWSSRRSN